MNITISFGIKLLDWEENENFQGYLVPGLTNIVTWKDTHRQLITKGAGG